MQRRKYALLKQPLELDALGDVTLTNPVLGDVMYYDGSFWINTPYAELVDDRVAALLVAGNNIDITYNDGAGTITIDVEALTSADVTDFNEAVDDRVGSLLVAGSNITLTYNDGANTLTVAAATPALNDLTDVDTTGVADGEALIYDSGTSTWVAGAVAGSSPTTTAGDLIKRGASADERLAIGTEGQVLTVVSGAPAWADAPAGGGGTAADEVSHPDAPPATPDAMDDEFEGTALDPKWTWRNQGSTTASVAGGCLMLTGNTGATNISILEQTASGNFKIRAKLGAHLTTNYQRVGLAVVNNASGKVITFDRLWEGLPKFAVTRWSSVTAWNANVALTDLGNRFGPASHFVYMEIEYDGTNIHFRLSGNGVHFTTFLTEAAATFLGTPDRVGLNINPDSSGTAPVGVYEWFRKIGSTYAPGKFIANGTLVSETSEQFVYKSADTTRASTTTLADDPDLTITLPANSVYEFDIMVLTRLESTPGLQITPAFSGTTTWVVVDCFQSDNGATNFSASSAAYSMAQRTSNSLPMTIGFSGSSQMANWRFRGMISVGASGGTFSIQWAQYVSSATAARVERGSFMRVKKVA